MTTTLNFLRNKKKELATSPNPPKRSAKPILNHLSEDADNPVKCGSAINAVIVCLARVASVFERCSLCMMAFPFPAESVANEEGATVLVWYASLASDFRISLVDPPVEGL